MSSGDRYSINVYTYNVCVQFSHKNISHPSTALESKQQIKQPRSFDTNTSRHTEPNINITYRNRHQPDCQCLNTSSASGLRLALPLLRVSDGSLPAFRQPDGQPRGPRGAWHQRLIPRNGKGSEMFKLPQSASHSLNCC